MTAVSYRSGLITLIAAGAIALGWPAIAGADPNNGGGPGGGEWDIGAYDSCLRNHPPYYSDSDKLDHYIQCCASTGGVWSSGGKCTAPSAQGAGQPQGPIPPLVGSRPEQQQPPPPNPTAPLNPGTFG
jgi:hypothetical protein